MGNCNTQRKDVLGEISITLRKAISYQPTLNYGMKDLFFRTRHYQRREREIRDLAPLLMYDMFRALKKLNEEGMTILLIEQNAHVALQCAHRGYLQDTRVPSPFPGPQRN